MEDYGDSGSGSGGRRADLVATLYERVQPNPHPVRLEGRKQQQQQQQQLAPLNPLYVRRFAAEIARYVMDKTGLGRRVARVNRPKSHTTPKNDRDGVGRQFEALALLLPQLQDLCPRELATLLAHVVEVFARSPSPTYRCA